MLMHDVQYTVTEVSTLPEEKRDLLTMLTHDLRSPDINMQQAMQLTEEEADREITEKLYRSIEHAAEKQLALIEAVQVCRDTKALACNCTTCSRCS